MTRKAMFSQSTALLMMLGTMGSAAILPTREYTLPVPGMIQGKSNWCWAAISEAVLTYYGKWLDQETIAAYGTPGQPNAVNDLFQATRPNHGVDEILAYFGAVYSLGVYSPVPGSDVVESIENLRRPMPIGLRDSSGRDHMMVIIGVNYDSQNLSLRLMDPVDGIKFWLLYDDVVSGDNYQWIETLALQRLSTMSDEAVPMDTTSMNPQNNRISSDIDLPAIPSDNPNWDGMRLSNP